MRKNVTFWKSLVGALPFLFLGTACDSASDDPDPYLRISEDNQSITLSADGTESKTIAVETNTSEWTVSVSANDTWYTAKREGETIVISADKNEDLSERSATVTVSARNVEVKIKVTQSGASVVLQIED
jgi:sarcosine oxidase gamma subunit